MEKETFSTAHSVASKLLEIGAIKLNLSKPFQWSSGWNSPIYCDNRLSLSFPEIRSFVRDALVLLIEEEYPEANMIAGVATAGIPQGVLVADEMSLPFCYVRSSAKGHGLTNRIEGKLSQGDRVVVIEDLVSTGGSSLSAVEAIRKAGAEVIGMAAIFTYGFQIASENFERTNVKLNTLSDYAALITIAEQRAYIKPEQVENLKAWRVDPASWGK